MPNMYDDLGGAFERIEIAFDEVGASAEKASESLARMSALLNSTYLREAMDDSWPSDVAQWIAEAKKIDITPPPVKSTEKIEPPPGKRKIIL